MRRLSLACAALAVAALAVPSVASGNYASIDVRYSDLDISKPAGAGKLLSRIKAAADEVCGRPGSRLMPAVSLASYAQCKMAAVNNAVRMVNSPILAAVYGKPELVVGSSRALAASGGGDAGRDQSIAARDHAVVSNH